MQQYANPCVHHHRHETITAMEASPSVQVVSWFRNKKRLQGNMIHQELSQTTTATILEENAFFGL